MKNQISEFLQSRIEAKEFPSAVYLVAEKGEIVFEDALGLAVVEPERIKTEIDTIYDLASLTKVLVTGLLCANLVENGVLKLSAKVAEFFPDFETNDKKDITIQHLLTHSSGFRGWLPFYLISDSKSKIPKLIANEPLENPINSTVVYSDLNFLLLGNLVEATYRKSLSEVAKQEIFDRLSLKDTFFNPPESFKHGIAASEKGNGFEKQTCLELGYQIENSNSVFREELIWGEVHDNNSYFMNGVSGHAGLFSNVREVFEIAKQFLPETTSILKFETCALFRKNFTSNLNQARSFAFQLAKTKDSTAGDSLSKESFGHLGFTGTSLWMDPVSQRIFILLTNRTHDRDLPFADLKITRQKFHNIACKLLDSKDPR